MKTAILALALILVTGTSGSVPAGHKSDDAVLEQLEALTERLSARSDESDDDSDDPDDFDGIEDIKERIKRALRAHLRRNPCRVVEVLDEILEELTALRERHPRRRFDRLIRRVWMLRLRVLERLPEGQSCGGDHSFLVDPRLRPSSPELPGLDGVTPRPLARMADHNGNRADFVSNELVLATDSPDALAGLIARWGGELLASLAPGDMGLSGVPALHLVRIDTELAGTEDLVSDWQALHPSRGGAYRVSTEEGLRLLAVAGREAAAGLPIGMSWIGVGQDFRLRVTVEAPVGPAGFNSSSATNYVGDAYDWHFLNRGSEQDVGATEAWTLLDHARRLSNRVGIGILDMGFVPDRDFPAGVVAVSNVPRSPALGTQNLVGCSAGPCPYHGTNVTGAAMGVPDNGYGASGSAGPVGVPVLIFTVGDPFSTIAAMTRARVNGARIVNMSYGVTVPAPFSLLLGPFDLLTGAFRGAGLLPFASAGNDGKDVDAEDCFFGCWEEARHWPCEGAGVTCVGGLARNSQEKTVNSNYGRHDVDIYAPYGVLVGPDPNNPGNIARAVSGTSFSSPHAAGVAALIWAADPTLPANDVERILFETAHRPSPPDSFVNRWVNALGAVELALPSLVRIESPRDGLRVSRGTTVDLTAFVWEGGRGSPTLTWSSDRDGVLGSGTGISRNNLSFGAHRITALATFADGFATNDSVLVEILNDPPQVEITRPAPGASVFQSEAVIVRGTSFDPNNVETGFRLLDSQVSWHLDGSATPLASGHNATLVVGPVAPGPHTLSFRGIDDGSLSDEASVTLNVAADPSNLPPTTEILEPANGANFVGAGAINATFRGRGTDPEDGDVSDTLVWMASLNGAPFVEIGRGPLINVPLVAASPSNSYAIRLVATDRDGVPSAPDIIQITVTLFF